MKFPITFFRNFITYAVDSGGSGESGVAPATSEAASSNNPFAPSTAEHTSEAPAESSTPVTEAPATAAKPAPVQAAASIPATQQSAVVGLSKEQLKELVDAARSPARVATPQEPVMSEEEFKKAFNIFEATPEMYEQILGVKADSPARVAALNNALQQVSRQSVTIMRYLVEQKTKELQNEFNTRIAPVTSNLRAQTEQQYFNEFTNMYPGLKDYQPLLKEIVDAARGRGEKFDSPQAAMEFVANRASKALGKPLDSLKATALVGSRSSTQAPTQQPGARQMSTMSMGGRSGSSGGAATTQSTAERIFKIEP
jgi:uncharacterized protein YukE